MLEYLDLMQKVKKEDYKKRITELEYRLAALQREYKSLGIPVVVVFEGWEAAGKGTCINRLMRSMDPRGFKVYSLTVLSREEKLRPYLWWYAIRIPKKGYFTVFDRSWYGRVLLDRIEGVQPEHIWTTAYDEIDAFERQLVNAGYVIIKLFCHISKAEQARRFKKMEKDPTESWKVTPEGWQEHHKYEEYVEAAEEMILKTSTPVAPWTLVESEDRCFMHLKVFKTVIRFMEIALEKRKHEHGTAQVMGDPMDAETMQEKLVEARSFWSGFDLNRKLDFNRYTTQLGKLQKEIRRLHHRMYMERIGACVVFQGWDASGKGGAIRRMLAPLDPRGFEVVTIGAPTEIELAHHYLWRFWTRLPKAGHLTIFDRSWYGRVLVERIEGFCSREEWGMAFQEINEFEKALTNFRMVLVKIWLQIDKDEQLRRFRDREEKSYKQWKITPEDWRNREKWDHYEIAAAEMIRQTSTSYAPWMVVESNNKLFTRIKVLETCISAIRTALDDTRPKPPLIL